MPFAIFGDFVRHTPVSGQVILGATIVLLSFGALIWDSGREGDAKLDGDPLDEDADEEIRPFALQELDPARTSSAIKSSDSDIA